MNIQNTARAFRIYSVVGILITGLMHTSSTNAATVYWDADASGVNNLSGGPGFLGGAGNWNNSLSGTPLVNWWSGSGSTDQSWVNANNDTAAFYGGAAGTVTLTASNTVGGLLFGTTGYTIATGANTLTFGAATNTVTLNNIAAATITGTVAGTGNVLLTGGILNGNTAGTLTLNGTSTGGWTGTTTVNSNMTLVLSGSSQALAGTSGITLNGGGIRLANTTLAEAGLDRVANSAGLTSNGGALTVTNTVAAATPYSETLGSVALASGQLNIVTTNANTGGTQVLTLSGLSQAGSATVAFGAGGGLNTATNQVVVTGASATTAGTIVGPWATVGTTAALQTDYAVYDGSSHVIAANIAGSSQSTWTTASDAYTNSTSGTITLTGDRLMNAWRYNNTTAGTLALGGFNFDTKGILNGNTGALTISGAGNIRQEGTAAANLYITTGSGAITINSTIADNTGALTLVKSGSTGTLTLGAANTYSGATIINAGVLAAGSLANGGVASAVGQSGNAAANLVLNGGTLQYVGGVQNTDRLFSVGLAGGTLDASGTGVVNFTNTGAMGFNGQSGSRTLILSGTNASNNTLAAVIGDNGDATSLVKTGVGTWVLSGANTYTGATTINQGKLTLSGGNDRLATSGTVVFNGTAGILDLGSNNQTLAGLSGSGVASAATITGTGTLTLNGGSLQVGGTAGTQSINMAGLANFAYSNAAGALNVGAVGAGSETLTLGTTNSITAAYFGIAANALNNGTVQGGTVHLGQTNTINANTLVIGSTTGSALLDVTSGLTGATLKIRGTGGANTDLAAMTVGGQNTGFANSSGTFDMGASGVLDAKLSTLMIGENLRANPSVNGTTTGTFTMGAGTLDATSITLGKNVTGTATGVGGANGTFTLNGGTVSTGTLTIANRVAAGTNAVVGVFNLNSGILNVTTINTGTGASSTFNWADGTIANNTGVNQTIGLLSTFNLTNTGNTSGTHTWDVSGSQTSTLSAILSGNGSLTKTNTGTLILNASNTFTGSTTVSGGTLSESATGFLADTSALTVNGSGAVFNLGSNHSDTVAVVTVDGGGSITGTGTSTLTSTGSFEVKNGTVSAILGGSGTALNKTTAGTVTLSGINTYTGATSISAGTLLVNGSLSASSTISVAGTGTLGGTSGTVGAVTVSTGGTLSPGSSIGTFNTASVDLQSGSILKLEIGTSTGTLTGDLLNITGAFDVAGGSNLNLTVLGTDTLLSLGQTFTLVDYGSVWTTGTFAGYADDSVFTLGLNSYQIDYNNGTALTLTTVAAVPEPSTYLLVVLGVGSLGILRRRQSRKV